MKTFILRMLCRFGLWLHNRTVDNPLNDGICHCDLCWARAVMAFQGPSAPRNKMIT